MNSVVNPEKLAHLGPLADMRALLRASVGTDRGGGTDVTSSDTTPR